MIPKCGLPEGEKMCRLGLGPGSNKVALCCSTCGLDVVESFCGHGIGRSFHEDPEVPNAGKSGSGARLANGMTLAIEPMTSADGGGVNILRDGWTVVTKSGALSAHFEHTVAVMPSGPVILTEL